MKFVIIFLMTTPISILLWLIALAIHTQFGLTGLSIYGGFFIGWFATDISKTILEIYETTS